MTSSTREVRIAAKPCHALTDRERRAFFKIHHAYYSGTPTGFDELHRENYRRMMTNQPNSIAYFVEIGGRKVAAALVLKQLHASQQKALDNRFYSMAVSEQTARKLFPERAERLRQVTKALGMLADRIIEDHPKAWGTVNANEISRINFFRKRRWEVAREASELLERVKYVHPQEKFTFSHTPEGWLVFSRSNSIHARSQITGPHGRQIVRKKALLPQYEQVLLVPKKK